MQNERVIISQDSGKSVVVPLEPPTDIVLNVSAEAVDFKLGHVKACYCEEGHRDDPTTSPWGIWIGNSRTGHFESVLMSQYPPVPMCYRRYYGRISNYKPIRIRGVKWSELRDYCLKSQPADHKNIDFLESELRKIAERACRMARSKKLIPASYEDDYNEADNLFLEWVPPGVTDGQDPYFWAKRDAFCFGVLMFIRSGVIDRRYEGEK